MSCIVPAYNAERFIEEALQSIAAQTHRPLEIVVVDDGSTDETGSLVRDFAERSDIPVRYVHQENAGPPPARNRGLREARGDFVAFLDADDLWTEDKLEVQLERFRERPELDVCFAYAKNFWMEEVRGEEGRIEGTPRTRPHPYYVAGTLLAPRALFDEVGAFDEAEIFGDVPAWYQELRRSGDANVEVVEDVLLHRRLHRDNHSRQATPESRRDFLRAVKSQIEHRRAMAGGDGDGGEGSAGGEPEDGGER